MNYRLLIGGYRFPTYDECLKLLIHSARQSDYVTSVRAYPKHTAFSALVCELFLTGSSKKEYQSIILDFDGVFGAREEGIVLSPEILELSASPSAVHYWAILGSLCKIINDISPAYVTGYLLERNKRREQETFASFSGKLPFALQIAVNEAIKDAD